MNIEVSVPDDWTPGQAWAVGQLLQHAVRNAQPVIALVRNDVTAEQLQDIYRRVEEVIREACLEVQPAQRPHREAVRRTPFPSSSATLTVGPRL